MGLAAILIVMRPLVQDFIEMLIMHEEQRISIIELITLWVSIALLIVGINNQ